MSAKPKKQAKKPRRVVVSEMFRRKGLVDCGCLACRLVRMHARKIGTWKTLRLVAEVLS